MMTLQERFAQHGIEITAEQEQQFQKYMELVLDNNNRVNLTAIKEEEEFHVKHFLDSVIISDRPEYQEAKKIIDVGTGGGFPGIPLAIISPEKEFVLMDSLRKRMDLVREMAAEIGLQNVTVVHSRAEDMGKSPEYREKFDLCVSRAVANLAVLSEYCLPFVRKGGAFISYKSGEVDEEVKESKKAIHILGGEIAELQRVDLDDNKRTFVVVKKESNTPKKYPRKAGTPSKSPIR